MFSLPSQSRRVGDGARCWSSEAICSKLSASNNWNSILGKFARGSVKFKWWIYMKINDIVALYLHTSTGATRSWQILQVKSYRFDFFPRRPRNTISTSSAALFLLCFSAECLWASRRMNIKKEDDNEFLLFFSDEDARWKCFRWEFISNAALQVAKKLMEMSNAMCAAIAARAIPLDNFRQSREWKEISQI